MANPINVSDKRMCFNDETKLDSSFPDDAVPPHRFHLGEVTYFATVVQVHLRQYKRNETNRLFPTKSGVSRPLELYRALDVWPLHCFVRSSRPIEKSSRIIMFRSSCASTPDRLRSDTRNFAKSTV
ncbi:hypothetical protein NPIL_447301 [Nephila pilipes]|uniref:Uncharacterized protein n=1 Tax=Nephila pilipes TaxID=299642 RepID=A0A8X6MYX9_NEPPI|nr:hypothetical protein NPIL_447301 [Nephila pilipes]